MSDNILGKPSTQTDNRLLLLNLADNIFGVARPIRAGEEVVIEGVSYRLDKAAGVGFKVARSAIKKGETILKYGATIGIASADIAAGELVHVHNTQSTYLPNTEVTGGEKK